MQRWNIATGEDHESKRIDAFLQEIAEVCKKHGLSISHEDAHGAFVIEKYDDGDVKRLFAAHDGGAGK